MTPEMFGAAKLLAAGGSFVSSLTLGTASLLSQLQAGDSINWVELAGQVGGLGAIIATVSVLSVKVAQIFMTGSNDVMGILKEENMALREENAKLRILWIERDKDE